MIESMWELALFLFCFFGLLVLIKFLKRVVDEVLIDRFGTTALPKGSKILVYVLSGIILFILWPLFIFEQLVKKVRKS